MDMNTENNNIAAITPTEAEKTIPTANSAAKNPADARKSFARRGGEGERVKNHRRGNSTRPERIKPEFDQKILNIRRVTRVTKGGKRMNFSIAMAVGNRKGSVGVGTGKANDTSAAIDKAYRNAKKNVIQLNLTKTMSIPHDVSAKYSSGRVMIIPAPGRGVSAGSAMKNVIELAGINDVTAKIISPSKNKLNISRAAIMALSAFDKRKFTMPQKEEVKTAETKNEAKSEK
jgi:small subunit ribosomal protein S5